MDGLPMIAIYDLRQIKNAMSTVDPVAEIEAAFVAYSQGRVTVPPVGEMLFDDPPGEIHIKYGFIRGADDAVVKIASGFSNNARMGLATGSGLILVMSQKTGHMKAILLDEGYLTDTRTAAAGAVAARYFAPKNVSAIGVIGSGVQARLQVKILHSEIECRNLIVWSRSPENVDRYASDMRRLGYQVIVASGPQEVAERSQVIITTTPSLTPLIQANWVKPGSHITAMGSDTSEKQELHQEVLAAADVVVVDSLLQAVSRGEVSRAIAAGALTMSRVVELGQAILDPTKRRNTDEQITVADLTGVAAQDIAIAAAVLRGLPNAAAD
jgi:ornithine cyclodeaminase